MKASRTALLAVSLLAWGVGGAVIPSLASAAPASQAASADKRSGAREARAMLEEAVSYLQDNGPARAFAAFNNQNGSFHRNDLYIFAVGIDDGIMHAYGAAPEAIVGADVRDLRDAAGKPVIKEMLAVVNRSDAGTVNYVWLNRVTNRVEDKTSMVHKVGKYLIGVGYYTR
jgi:cytochrome c